MKILLSGSTGFVGKALYEKLSQTYDVYVIGRTRIEGVKENKFIFWNFLDQIPSTLPPVNTIIHAAQSRHYRSFPEKVDDLFKVNVASTAALLSYAEKRGVERFILFSSGSVYEPFTRPIIESEPLAPSSYYSVNKYSSELLSLCYKNMMKLCIFRLFFVYGPGQEDRLIPNLINKISTDRPVILTGNNGFQFTPIFIDDVVSITQSALLNNWEGIINLASPEIVTIRGVSELIAKKMGKKVKFDMDSSQGPLRIIPSLEKLKMLYHPFNFNSIIEGLDKTMESRILCV